MVSRISEPSTVGSKRSFPLMTWPLLLGTFLSFRWCTPGLWSCHNLWFLRDPPIEVHDFRLLNFRTVSKRFAFLAGFSVLFDLHLGFVLRLHLPRDFASCNKRRCCHGRLTQQVWIAVENRHRAKSWRNTWPRCGKSDVWRDKLTSWCRKRPSVDR